jgi:DNA-binding CsgD family transcriptional regulator
MTELSLEARAILGLMATGLSTSEVAAHLGRSPAEIRCQLAGAIEQGLIDQPQLLNGTRLDRS